MEVKQISPGVASGHLETDTGPLQGTHGHICSCILNCLAVSVLVHALHMIARMFSHKITCLFGEDEERQSALLHV